MIINVVSPQFPEGSRVDIEAKKAACSSLELNFSRASNEVITSDSIRQFSNYIKENFRSVGTSISANPAIHIDLLNIEFLTPEKAVVLLENQDFVNYLSDLSLKKIILSSMETIDFSLASEHISRRLNSLEPGIDSQTFDRSCAARATMRLLREHGLLDKKDDTRTNELRIYKETCRAAADIASPEKIIAYLEAHHLSTKGVEVKDRAHQILEETKKDYPASYPLLQGAHTLFRHVTTDNVVMMDLEKIDESAFLPGTTSLLVTRVEASPGVVSTHIVFAKKNAKGEFEVLDPNGGSITKYLSFQEYVQNVPEFVGVGFKVEKAEHKRSVAGPSG